MAEKVVGYKVVHQVGFNDDPRDGDGVYMKVREEELTPRELQKLGTLAHGMKPLFGLRDRAIKIVDARFQTGDIQDLHMFRLITNGGDSMSQVKEK